MVWLCLWMNKSLIIILDFKRRGCDSNPNRQYPQKGWKKGKEALSSFWPQPVDHSICEGLIFIFSTLCVLFCLVDWKRDLGYYMHCCFLKSLHIYVPVTDHQIFKRFGWSISHKAPLGILFSKVYRMVCIDLQL